MIGKLDAYRIFNVVSRNQSFSKAASELYMTQPAVSQAISKLEKELETYLFNRTPKGVTLTNEGELLHEYVNSALGILDAGEEKMLEFKNLTTGQLSYWCRGYDFSLFFIALFRSIPYKISWHKIKSIEWNNE